MVHASTLATPSCNNVADILLNVTYSCDYVEPAGIYRSDLMHVSRHRLMKIFRCYRHFQN